MNTNTGPELDEATATACVILIDNHISAMQAWKRKLTQPYLPKPTHYPYTPIYTKPTLATAMHIMVDAAQLRLEILQTTNKFLAAKVKEKQ